MKPIKSTPKVFVSSDRGAGGGNSGTELMKGVLGWEMMGERMKRGLGGRGIYGGEGIKEG
ncbi:hypothetical protein A0H81_08730 [Grifola frondosa]|uniref:Uncharacterized protein n=1 Tax=Grifola frondosa TaxID=5627 RepID=A0A1C7M2I2_GRIFR|nr:hypothetical protein A0H81_08730 [Grifola frondosa]